MKTVTKSLQFIRPVHERTRQESVGCIVSKSSLAILLFLGIGGNLKKLILPETKIMLLAVMGLAGCIIFTIILDYKKIRFIGMLVTLCWLVFYCTVLYEDISNGLRLCGNHVGEILGQRFGRIYPIYSITAEAQDYVLCVMLFFIPICVLLGFLCSYLAQNGDSIFSFILVAGIVGCNGYLEIEFSPLWLGVLILAQAMMFRKKLGTQDQLFRVCRKPYLYGMLMTVALLIIVGIVSFFVIPSYEKGPFSEAKKGLIRYVDRIRYGVDESLSLPDGDFDNLQRYEPSTKTALEVTMEKPESLWLRGYVGSVYNGRGWSKDGAKERYKYADLFYWLHKDNFYGQKQLVDAAFVSGKELVNHSSGMRIRNIGASSRNIYAPYEFYYGKEELMPASQIGDSALHNSGFFGRREYDYVVLPNIVKRYPDVINGLYSKNQSTASIESFLHIEENYSEFIYREYTKIPKKTKIWMDKYLTELDPQKENVNFTSAKQAIITFLTEKTTYTTKPAKSLGKDLAYDFLFTDRTGYSVHYATAATLMFRYLGIPSRYVEGYLITPKDVKSAKDNVILKIDGTHSHAWTEVYLDGAGWIPVEVTPPYFGLMEEADSFEGVQGGNFDSNEGKVKDKDDYKVQSDLLDLDETKGIKNTKLPWIIIMVAGILMILAIILFLYILNKKQAWMRKRVSACLNSDHKEAVKAMFICGMESLSVFGLQTDGVWLLSPLRIRIDVISAQLAKEFDEVFHLYEKAVYSSSASCEEERKVMQNFLRLIQIYFIEHSTGFKRLTNRRWIKLYAKIGFEHTFRQKSESKSIKQS